MEELHSSDPESPPCQKQMVQSGILVCHGGHAGMLVTLIMTTLMPDLNRGQRILALVCIISFPVEDSDIEWDSTS